MLSRPVELMQRSKAVTSLTQLSIQFVLPRLMVQFLNKISHTYICVRTHSKKEHRRLKIVLWKAKSIVEVKQPLQRPIIGWVIKN
jgi:hypothetical protein